jgi:hypothetical protein
MTLLQLLPERLRLAAAPPVARSVAVSVVPATPGVYTTPTQHDTFRPRVRLEHLLDAIENADEPISLIANFPDIVRLQFVSLNALDTREPLRR